MIKVNMHQSIVLYRYLSADDALKTIKSRSLKVSRICELNDPFEFRFGLTGIAVGKESAGEEFIQSVVDGLNDWLGILCFSDTHAEPVLWSHYADKHKGAALECDYLVEPDKLFKVTYSNERPVIDARRKPDEEGFQDYALPIFKCLMAQKSRGWAYESEYRAFVDLRTDCVMSPAAARTANLPVTPSRS